MQLTESERSWLMEAENRQDLLGQVFTPEDVAELMVSLAMRAQPAVILEPCFGEGVFLRAILQHLSRTIGAKSPRIIGIELDPELYQAVRQQYPEAELYEQDFFDMEQEVDSVIMNPPYIRQERLGAEMPKFLNKEAIWSRLPLTATGISPRSNLYIYFFIKAWAILREHGEITAIVPNTWMAADYGESFRHFLLTYFQIRTIIQFNRDVFPDADVDSCIVHLVKDTNGSTGNVRFINIEQALDRDELRSFASLIHHTSSKLTVKTFTRERLQTENNWLGLFHEHDAFDIEGNLVPLAHAARLKRGLTTNSNAFFIDEAAAWAERFPECFSEILCSPKELQGFSTHNMLKKQHILMTQQLKSELPQELQQYINQYEQKVLTEASPKTLHQKIIDMPESWFHLKSSPGAPLLFSYIVRERKKFILNEPLIPARDNFYEIFPNQGVSLYALFAILNSRITSLFLENIGRSHGKGLLKIQKYELEQLRIVDPTKLKDHDAIKLEALGKALAVVNEEQAHTLITEIDTLLLSYVSTHLKAKDVERLLVKQSTARLDKRNGHLQLTKEESD